MNNLMRIPAIAALTILALLAVTGCMEDKVLDLVLKSEAQSDFIIDDNEENYSETGIVFLGDEITTALEDADLDREDVKDAFLVGVDYGITEFSQAHDWITSGSIAVTSDLAGVRATATIVEYTDVSVEGALDQRFHATLVQEGVDLVNAALDDFLAGGSPELSFTIIGGNVEPSPSDADRIQFTWRGWLIMHVVGTSEFEFPDPF